MSNTYNLPVGSFYSFVSVSPKCVSVCVCVEFGFFKAHSCIVCIAVKKCTLFLKFNKLNNGNSNSNTSNTN